MTYTKPQTVSLERTVCFRNLALKERQTIGAGNAQHYNTHN